MVSIPAGTRASVDTGSGTRVNSAARIAVGFCAVAKGVCPVIISYITTPSVKMSLAAVSSPPTICSGDM